MDTKQGVATLSLSEGRPQYMCSIASVCHQTQEADEIGKDEELTILRLSRTFTFKSFV